MSEKENTPSPAGASELAGRSSGAPLEKAPSSPPARNKRSSFFVYLAVLFGAAFLMLLLAYFIQQRNNATVQSDLRSSFSSSRQELLEEIQRLEEEITALHGERDTLKTQLDGCQEEIDNLNEQVVLEHSLYVNSYDRWEALLQFTLLEQAIRERDWDTAAKRTRALCSGALELDKARIELPGEAPFDPRARLEEVIPMLEKQGALKQGEVSIPAPEAG